MESMKKAFLIGEKCEKKNIFAIHIQLWYHKLLKD